MGWTSRERRRGTPMKFSAAERTRPTLGDGAVAVAVLAAAGLLLFLFRPTTGNFLTARIVLDNELVAELALSDLDGPVTLDVPNARYPITVEVEPGRIRIGHSDCPSQDCVRTGWVSRAGGQIVCLPNRLVISVTGNAAPDVDGVTG